MKLTIEIISNNAFRILEQDTSPYHGWQEAPIYSDTDIAIFTRGRPEFKYSYSDSDWLMPVDSMCLYLRGVHVDHNEDIVYCGNYLPKVISKLKQAFENFNIVNSRIKIGDV